MYGGRQTGLRWVGPTVLLTYRPIVILATAAFLMAPDSCAWLEDALGFDHDRITGDIVSPEFRSGGDLVVWLDNRMTLTFKKVSN